MKKVLLSTAAMAAFFAGSLGVLILEACSGPKPVTEDMAKEEQTEVVASEELEPEFNSLELVIAEEPEVVSAPIRNEPTKKENPSKSYSSSPSYSSSYNNDSESDYWEEKRKHSPNDNYLLGFDEDVDDVHDMELYMEDY